MLTRELGQKALRFEAFFRGTCRGATVLYLVIAETEISVAKTRRCRRMRLEMKGVYIMNFMIKFVLKFLGFIIR